MIGLAADVLAQRQRQRARVVVVGARGQDLDQLDHLPLRVRQLEAHARLAGDRLDDTDADHRKRAREVLHQVDDLAALDPDRRLDLEARDHRAGIGRQHLDRDAEVGELALDQPRRVFERVGVDGILRRRRILEQVERRQRRVGQLVEQRPLPLLDHPRRLLHLRRRGDDQHRLAGRRLLPRVRDHGLALGQRVLGQPALGALVGAAAQRREQVLDPGADALHELQPRHAEEQRAPGEEEGKQQQRRAVVEGARQARADEIAHRPARRLRQGHRQPVEAQRLERRTRQQDKHEPEDGQRQRVVGGEFRVGDAAIAGDDQNHPGHDPPPGGETEQVEQQVGEPGAGHAALVADRGTGAGERPARGRSWCTSRGSARARRRPRPRTATTTRARGGRSVATAARGPRPRGGRGRRPSPSDITLFLLEKHEFAAETSSDALYRFREPVGRRSTLGPGKDCADGAHPHFDYNRRLASSAEGNRCPRRPPSTPGC